MRRGAQRAIYWLVPLPFSGAVRFSRATTPGAVVEPDLPTVARAALPSTREEAMAVPQRPSSQQRAPRPNRCWAMEDEDRTTSARAGRRPLPPAGTFEKPSSRPTSAKEATDPGRSSQMKASGLGGLRRVPSSGLQTACRT